MSQIDHVYTVPVYTRVLQFAYMHKRNWADSRSLGAARWLEEDAPRIDLGRCSGKTSAVVAFAGSFADTLIVCQKVVQAQRIERRHSGVRALALDDLDRLGPDNFKSTDPLFMFDDVGRKDMITQLIKFQPTRFVHVGVWA